MRHEACRKDSSLPSLEANTVMKNVMSFMTFKDMITFYLSGGLTFIKEFKCLNNFLFRFVLLFKSVLVPLKGRTRQFLLHAQKTALVFMLCSEQNCS